MKIEHIGICVEAPISMGNWYRDHLGFEILMQAGDDRDGVSFVAADNGTVLELGRLPEVPGLSAEVLSCRPARSIGPSRLENGRGIRRQAHCIRRNLNSALRSQ